MARRGRAKSTTPVLPAVPPSAPERFVPSAARAAVELYYAHALLEYLSGYDWEIRQRERVVSVAPDTRLDLKAWTAEQIASEAERSFLAIWERRESLAAVPVADFPYLQGNAYPKGVRSTLRDAVSYLFVDRLLGDSSFWSASESNDAWQLDLGNLLADAPRLQTARNALRLRNSWSDRQNCRDEHCPTCTAY